MSLFIRKPWFQVAVIVIVVAGFDAFLLDWNATAEHRKAGVAALQSIAIIYAIISALVLMLYTNYVKGIRETYLNRARYAKQLAWEFHEIAEQSSDSMLKSIDHAHTKPLIEASLTDWESIDNIKDWSEGIEKFSKELANQYVHLMLKYIMPLEDEMNQLGILYLRSQVVGLHLKNIRKALLVLAAAFCVLAIGHLFPSSELGDVVIGNMALIVIVLSILELLRIISYIQQEGREEILDYDNIENEN